MILVAAGTISLPGACLRQELASIPSVSGVSFKITYTNCDVLAKHESIGIYASETPSRGGLWFGRWLHRDTLMFSYDPSGRDNSLPSVKSLGRNRVLISVPEVSAVLFQRREWQKVSIDYTIGRTTYP